MIEPMTQICVPELDRYRIAQMFHELARDLETVAVAQILSSMHGVSAEDVLAFAAEFPVEPLWRL
jgi:hypothetical protein